MDAPLTKVRLPTYEQMVKLNQTPESMFHVEQMVILLTEIRDLLKPKPLGRPKKL